MVRVYITDIKKLPDPLAYPEIMVGLPKERMEKILRLKREDDRRQSLGAGLLLKKILSERSVSFADIVYGENGKPEIERGFFNLSHSDEIVICSVSDRDVGCDVEKIKKRSEKLAERYFTKNEIHYLNQFTRDEQAEEFCRLWTMKESYLKMTGEGLTVNLNTIEFDLGNEIKVYRKGTLCRCFIKEYMLSGYKVTVCAQESEFADEMEWIELKFCKGKIGV